MIRNIFLVLLGVAIAFVGYKVFDLYQSRSSIANVEDGYRTGSKNATLEVVEFLDYGCPYCREAHPTITEAVRRDGNVSYVPRPVAFLGPDSAYAAVVAYAAGEQGKFIEMHDVLIRNFEALSPETLPSIAAQAGVDAAALQKAIDNGGLENAVLENLDLFEKMGLNATPAFIIGEDTIYIPEGRMPEVQDFLDMFAKARGEK